MKATPEDVLTRSEDFVSLTEVSAVTGGSFTAVTP